MYTWNSPEAALLALHIFENAKRVLHLQSYYLQMFMAMKSNICTCNKILNYLRRRLEILFS